MKDETVETSTPSVHELHLISVDQLIALHTALALAQGELSHAKKDAKNTHFKNRYATLTSCLDAIRGPFKAHGLALVQMPSTSEDGKRVAITTVITHRDGGSISSTLTASAGGNVQQMGSAITYLRRYSLQAMCGIASEDDDGEAASAPSRQQRPAKKKAAPKMEETTPEPFAVADFWAQAADALKLESDTPLRQYMDSIGKAGPLAAEGADGDRARHGALAWLQGDGAAKFKAWDQRRVEKELF